MPYLEKSGLQFFAAVNLLTLQKEQASAARKNNSQGNKAADSTRNRNSPSHA